MKKIFILLFILFINVYTFAFVFEGGLITETNRLIYKDQMLFIAGFSYLNDIVLNSNKFKVVKIPIGFRYGITPKIEFIGDIILNSQSSDFNNSPKGIERLNFGSRLQLNKLITTKFLLSVAGNNELYYAVDEIGGQIEVQSGFKLLLGYVNANVGYQFRGGDFSFDGFDTNTLSPIKRTYNNKSSLYYLASYNLPLMSNLSIFTEFCYKGKLNEASEKENYFNIGSKYELDEDIEIIAAVTKGISDGAPDLGINIQFNKYFGFNYYQAERRTRQPVPSREKFSVKEKPEVVIEDIKKRPAIEEKTTAETTEEKSLQKIKEKIKEIEQKNKGVQKEEKEVITAAPQKEAQILYCPNCGEQVPAESNFCPYCGFNLKNYKSQQSEKKEIIEDNKFIIKSEDEIKFNNYMEKGKIEFSKNNYKEAANYYKKALSINPINQVALYNTGVAYFYAEEYKTAKEYFEKAVSVNANDIDSLNYLAIIYNFEGNIQKAVDTFERVLRIDPKNQTAKANLERLGIYK